MRETGDMERLPNEKKAGELLSNRNLQMQECPKRRHLLPSNSEKKQSARSW